MDHPAGFAGMVTSPVLVKCLMISSGKKEKETYVREARALKRRQEVQSPFSVDELPIALLYRSSFFDIDSVSKG